MPSHRYERLLAKDDIELQIALLSLNVNREHIGLPPRRLQAPSTEATPRIFNVCLPTSSNQTLSPSTEIDQPTDEPFVSQAILQSIITAAANAKKHDIFSNPPINNSPPQNLQNVHNVQPPPKNAYHQPSAAFPPQMNHQTLPRNANLQRRTRPQHPLNQHSNQSSSQEQPPASNPAAPAFRTARSRLIGKRRKLGHQSGSKEAPQTSSGSGLGTGVAATATRAVLGPAKRARFSAPRPTPKTNTQPTRDDLPEIPNVDPQLVETVLNEALEESPDVDWDDIAGLHFAKKCVMEAVVWPMKRPDIFTGLRGPPKGLLLFGPPGTGKTMIGKAIASKSGAKFFNISASSMVSKWIGESEKLIRALFAVARHFQPSVIFIDEIDSMLTQRSGGEHEHSRRLKTEFLVQMDGAGTSREDRILVVGATNLPQELDEAARRRLVKRLYIPLPDDGARCSLVSRLLQKQTNSLSETDITTIGKLTDGYSGSDIYALCAEAALGPVRELGDALGDIDVDKVRPVNLKDFEFATKMVRASVSQKDLKGYVEWNASFGSFPINENGT